MSEFIITADLVLDSALHVGVGKEEVVTDAPIRRHGDGRLMIPGRAIGGSLRTLTTRLAPRLGFAPCIVLQPEHARPDECTCPSCALFGTVSFDEEDSEHALASSLWVYDAYGDVPTHVRDGVGISRQTGAAAHNVKFDYETVPPQVGEQSTTFSLEMRLQPLPIFRKQNVQEDNEEANVVAQMKLLLTAALAEWQAGRGQLGGQVARGLGRFHLKNVTVQEIAISNEDELVAYLLDEETVDYKQDVTQEWWAQLDDLNIVPQKDDESDLPISHSFVAITLILSFHDLYLSNDPLVSLLSGFDHAPLVSIVQDVASGLGQPVLSGSSLRGVLRSHAEKIARTLATATWQEVDKFLRNCPACDPLAQKEAPLSSCDARLKEKHPREEQETPATALCLSCRLFGSQRRGSHLWVQDGKYLNENLNATAWQAQDFLAIDHFTGGGKEGAKFDAAPLHKAQFEAKILLHDPAAWELGWLVLILRDLADNRLTLGFGAAKGYGRLQLQKTSWKIGYLAAEDAPLPPALRDNVHQSGMYKIISGTDNDWLPDNWKDAAQTWVDAFNKQVTTPAPISDEGASEEAIVWQPFKKDSFWGTDAETLYGPTRTEVKNE